jgi:hypothetical protein
MSLTKVKDVDYLICMRLSEKDLKKFCKINKYYRSIYTGEELWKRKIYGMGIKYLMKGLNKRYYFELYNALKGDFVKQIFLAIHNDRPDILSLVLRKNDINPNFDFVLSKNYTGYEDRSYYCSERYDPNIPIVYSPIAMIIKKGSDVMWNILKSSKYPLFIEQSYYILAIGSKNLNILKDLLEYSLEYDNLKPKSYILYFALRSYSEESIELLLEYATESTIEQLFDEFVMDTDPEYLTWIKVRNEAFSKFLQDPRVKRNLGFIHYYNLQDNFSKLLNAYIGF